MKAFLLLVILVATIGNAYAYIDPGSMSIVMQAIAGVVVGGIVTIRIYWRKIKEISQKIFSKKA